MDLNLFRKYDICSDLVDFAIDVAEYCEYGDQDILNYYFIDGYKLLDIKWNCGRELLEGREKEVGIVHYYGLEKPWKFGMASIFYIKKSQRNINQKKNNYLVIFFLIYMNLFILNNYLFNLEKNTKFY